jgi:FtsZ-binding cell division protein ZapB
MPIITRLRRSDLADIREAYEKGVHKGYLKKKYHLSQNRLQAILGDAWKVGQRVMSAGAYAENYHVDEDVPSGEEQAAPHNGITFPPGPTAPPAPTAPLSPAAYMAAIEARVLEFHQLLKEKDATHEQELRAKDARYEQLEMEHTKLLSEYQQTVFRQQNWTGPTSTVTQSLGNGG